MKQKYVKCLKVQDELFLKYFTDKEALSEKLKKGEIEKKNLMSDNEQISVKYAIIADAHNTIQKKTDAENKVHDFSSRLAISESELVKLKRRYQVLLDEQSMLRDSYTNL